MKVAVTDEAIQKIKDLIFSGQLVPGQRLPRESDLAARLGLSRNSLREAVRALAFVRILDVRQGDGTYVASLGAASLLEPLAFIVDLHDDASVLELLDVRRIFEPAASARAALLMDDADIDELGHLLSRAIPDSSVEELTAIDIEFHRKIVAGCKNSVLSLLIESLSGPTRRAGLWRRSLTQEGALMRTLSEHRAIFDAIRNHDPELASAWAAVHIAGVEEWLRSELSGTDLHAPFPPAHPAPS